MMEQSAVSKDQGKVLTFLYGNLSSRVIQCFGGNVSPIELQGFCAGLLNFIQSDNFQTNLHEHPLVLTLVPDQSGKGDSIFDGVYIKSIADSGSVRTSNVIHIDPKGRIIKTVKTVIDTLDGLSDYSEKVDGLCILVYQCSINAIRKGKHVKEISNVFTLDETRNLKNKYPISKYRMLVTIHKNKYVDGHRGIDYWENKKEWKLRAKPEKIFRKSLTTFLDDFVADGRVDEECRNANTDNRNDIRIITFDGSVYIMEVKWLGKSAGGDILGTQADKTSNDAIVQLTIYLEAERKSIRGTVVIYDARTSKTVVNWNPTSDKWNALIDKSPIFVALDPTSASVKSKKG